MLESGAMVSPITLFHKCTPHTLPLMATDSPAAHKQMEEEEMSITHIYTVQFAHASQQFIFMIN